MAYVEIKNLVKRYRDLVAVDHLNLEIEKGEIYGLLGPNGSGKTTVLNCLLALLYFDKGSIRIDGKEMSPDAYDIKKKIGVVMQNVAVFGQLSVWENIDYFCGLYVEDKRRRRELDEEALRFTGLENFRKKKPKELSGGLLRRLNIACGIVHKPELLILDEPTVAVDPQSRNRILEGIQEMNREGTTVIYTSHYIEEVEQICHRVTILDQWKALASGTVEELKRLINTGDIITLEGIYIEEEQLAEIRLLPHVFRADYDGEKLTLRCRKAKDNLLRVLHFLQEREIPFENVFSQLPTLNDVFLEITGKELRD